MDKLEEVQTRQRREAEQDKRSKWIGMEAALSGVSPEDIEEFKIKIMSKAIEVSDAT